MAFNADFTRSSQMSEETEPRWQAPLKLPAIEVVDLLSDASGELINGSLLESTRQKRDASEAESESEDDSQWDDNQWSLYEDALQGEDDDSAIHGSTLSALRVLMLD